MGDQKYNRWTVIGEKQRVGHDTAVLCRCECGVEKLVSLRNMKRGQSKGCYMCSRRSVSLPDGESAKNRILATYKTNAQKRKLAWELSDTQFFKLTQAPCFWCGEKPSQIQKSNSRSTNYIYNGIDRLDNNLGYTETNSVPCCWTHNVMKGSLDTNTFIAAIFRAHTQLSSYVQV